MSDVDYDIETLKQSLKNLMWDKAGILRKESELLEAQKTIKKMQADFKRERKCLNKEEYEYRNMLTAAELVVESALMRKESRGAHARIDYTQTDSEGIHSNIIKTVNKELEYVK